MKENKWNTTAGVRDRPGQPRVAPPERVFGCRESTFARTPARPIALVRSGKIHLSRDRQTTRSQGLGPVPCVAKPDTILAWYRRLSAQKVRYGSKHRRQPGRTRI